MSSGRDAAVLSPGDTHLKTYDPVSVTMSHGRQQLYHNGFHFRLQERMGHVGQESFEVVLNEWHDDVYPDINSGTEPKHTDSRYRLRLSL